jgi:hypothetical protein
MREIFLLRLRDAIAEKEWTTAQANKELAQGGWRCDWTIYMNQTQAQIDHFTECLLNT